MVVDGLEYNIAWYCTDALLLAVASITVRLHRKAPKTICTCKK